MIRSLDEQLGGKKISNKRKKVAVVRGQTVERTANVKKGKCAQDAGEERALSNEQCAGDQRSFSAEKVVRSFLPTEKGISSRKRSADPGFATDCCKSAKRPNDQSA